MRGRCEMPMLAQLYRGGVVGNHYHVARCASSLLNALPITILRISDVPAPISYNLALRHGSWSVTRTVLTFSRDHMTMSEMKVEDQVQ